ncbi:hypothetical protein JMA_42990 (plasmid) [Jeotgalibacillus malaysiensis]|uniref:Uncharacterized protein n=1 Tax=Jeotgalibacillus malaysiensis TaxID=1508404 RepID=A0A0B5AU81_9BACL|nr:hypothetical protein [Jeotgalibacillus malaysiensis]AJD93616.1 hypothetical protein JMA_42990 [Jeotgalibacillus malaysiensis]
MLFEAKYKELKKPFDLMKSVLNDTDFKSEKHAVTMEVSEGKVLFSFIDPKSKVEMFYQLEEAETILDGVATCSLKILYDALKTFSKSEDVIMLEREEDELRVDDGVFPEEMFKLFDDGDMVVLEEVGEKKPLFKTEGKMLSDLLNRMSIVLRKTDFPAEQLDTQAVYITSVQDETLESASFSIHQSSYERQPAEVLKSFHLAFPKPKAKLMAKILNCLDNVTVSTGTSDEQPVCVLNNKNYQIVVKGDYEVDGNVFSALKSVFASLEERKEAGESISSSDIQELGKLTVRSNVAKESDKWKLENSGYPAKVLMDFFKAGFSNDNSVCMEVETDGVLAVLDMTKNHEKMFVMSYRSGESA